MRGAAFAQGFLLVPGRDPVVPRLAPVLGAFGQPLEPVFGNLLQRLADIVGNVGRHAEDLSKLPAAQRSGVLALIRNDTDRMLAFVGRFVEANPGKTLFTAAATTVILAEPERILGGDEVVFDAEGNPIVVRKGGLADRALDAGGNVAGHVSTHYLRPIVLTGAALAGVLLIAWLAFKLWQFKKFRSVLRIGSSQVQ